MKHVASIEFAANALKSELLSEETKSVFSELTESTDIEKVIDAELAETTVDLLGTFIQEIEIFIDSNLHLFESESEEEVAEKIKIFTEIAVSTFLNEITEAVEILESIEDADPISLIEDAVKISLASGLGAIKLLEAEDKNKKKTKRKCKK